MFSRKTSAVKTDSILYMIYRPSRGKEEEVIMNNRFYSPDGRRPDNVDELIRVYDVTIPSMEDTCRLRPQDKLSDSPWWLRNSVTRANFMLDAAGCLGSGDAGDITCRDAVVTFPLGVRPMLVFNKDSVYKKMISDREPFTYKGDVYRYVLDSDDGRGYALCAGIVHSMPFREYTVDGIEKKTLQNMMNGYLDTLYQQFLIKCRKERPSWSLANCNVAFHANKQDLKEAYRMMKEDWANGKFKLIGRNREEIDIEKLGSWKDSDVYEYLHTQFLAERGITLV